VFAAGISPLIGLFVEDLHMSEVDASRLPTWALLALGVSVNTRTPYTIIHIFSDMKNRTCGQFPQLHTWENGTLFYSPW
jgi:hypothetical protein